MPIRIVRRCARPLMSRPHLLAAVVLGVVIYFALQPWVIRDITRALLGWDGGIILFLLFSFLYMSGADASRMKRRAISHDEGGHLILALTLFAAVASVGALVAELTEAKGHGGVGRAGLAAGTVILSWLFVQVVFAMHYAHLYYLAESQSARHQGGLDFGYSDEEPDYWDFVHFAIVIGATSQTADIVFKSRAMRRVGTVHSVVAFGFNTAILATMINLAAGLF
jgi:uncharacterized membrane protein